MDGVQEPPQRSMDEYEAELQQKKERNAELFGTTKAREVRDQKQEEGLRTLRHQPT